MPFLFRFGAFFSLFQVTGRLSVCERVSAAADENGMDGWMEGKRVFFSFSDWKDAESNAQFLQEAGREISLSFSLPHTHTLSLSLAAKNRDLLSSQNCRRLNFSILLLQQAVQNVTALEACDGE